MAAEASFRTVIASISWGLRLDKIPASRGTPSITIRGELTPGVPLNELAPRITMSRFSDPGTPVRWLTTRPGSLPDRLVVTFTAWLLVSASPPTVAIEPVRVALFCVPYPTTTTCSKSVALDCNCTATLVLLPTFTSWETKPTELITRVEFGEASIEKLPPLSVWVAVVVFFTATVAPGTGELPDVTLPVTLCWAKTKKENRLRKMSNKRCGHFRSCNTSFFEEEIIFSYGSHRFIIFFLVSKSLYRLCNRFQMYIFSID